eukprot:g25490.t1
MSNLQHRAEQPRTQRLAWSQAKLRIGKVAAAQCRPAAAAAALVLAAAKIQAFLDGPQLRKSKAKKAVLRDVLELVTKAEDLIKTYSWHEGVAFGTLVGSEWNFWWVLQHLQLDLQRIFPDLWALPP